MFGRMSRSMDKYAGTTTGGASRQKMTQRTGK